MMYDRDDDCRSRGVACLLSVPRKDSGGAVCTNGEVVGMCKRTTQVCRRTRQSRPLPDKSGAAFKIAGTSPLRLILLKNFQEVQNVFARMLQDACTIAYVILCRQYSLHAHFEISPGWNIRSSRVGSMPALWQLHMPADRPNAIACCGKAQKVPI